MTDYYIVVEANEEYEQPLRLLSGAVLPSEGVLDWGDPVALFPTRAAAREAIQRTHHYAMAFQRDGLPEKKFCQIRKARVVEPRT